MSSEKTTSIIAAPTEFIDAGSAQYAYRRFGSGSKLPLLCLQHFTGTLDNWDPAVTGPLAAEREVIPVRERRSRSIQRHGAEDDSRHGVACPGLPGCVGAE